MAELRAPLEAFLDDPLDSKREERLFQLIAAKRRANQVGSRRRRQKLVLAAAAAMVLVGLSSFALGRLGRQQAQGPASADSPLLLAGTSVQPQELVSPPDRGREVELSDGSSLRLGAHTRVVFERNDGREVVLSLPEGEVDFFVRPGGSRRWQVETGWVRVEVVGTVFRLERTDLAVVVRVMRGRVRVSGPAVRQDPIELGAGDSRRFPRPGLNEGGTDAQASRREEVAPLDLDSNPELGGQEVQGSTGQARLSSRNMGWRELVAERRYREAYENLGVEGHTRRTAEATSVDELLALADAARLGGHPRQAVGPLERIVEGHSGDRRAAVAAFTLGRLRVDVLGDPGQGAEAFSKVLVLGAPAALRESAHARLVEARKASGDHYGARRAARNYLERYPTGRWSDSIRAWSPESE